MIDHWQIVCGHLSEMMWYNLVVAKGQHDALCMGMIGVGKQWPCVR